MSRKSPTTSQLITAGIVGVGVGVLASYAYVALSSSPNTSNLSVPQTPTRDAICVKPSTRRECMDSEENAIEQFCVKQNIRAIENGDNVSKCTICGVNITSEPSISLNCSHLFHRKCLFSTYVVQTKMNNGSFECPLGKCRAKIPRRTLESLIAFH